MGAAPSKLRTRSSAGINSYFLVVLALKKKPFSFALKGQSRPLEQELWLLTPHTRRGVGREGAAVPHVSVSPPSLCPLSSAALLR